jgi:hypothetical protein
MLCSIYFSLYRVLILLTPFAPTEVAITPTTLLMHNGNFLVDIYIYVTILEIFIWTGGPITATAHEAGRNPKIES